MQTFLPYPDFTESAKVLDNKRLGKQRVENLQLLQVLTRARVVSKANMIALPPQEWTVVDHSPQGWANHPAATMWQGHEKELLHYQVAICDEWTEGRGYKDSCLDKSMLIMTERRPEQMLLSGLNLPKWFGDEAFHASHRSNLLRKDPEWYGQFGWTEGPDLGYVWP